MPLHHHRAAKRAVVVERRAQRAALGRVEHGRHDGVAARIELVSHAGYNTRLGAPLQCQPDGTAVRYTVTMYQPPEIILDLFAAYRRAAGLPELSREERLRLLVAAEAPLPQPAQLARVIPFPEERSARARPARR